MIYHQSVAWAVNHGLPAFLDAMVCLQVSRQLPPGDAAQRLKLLEQGLDQNPYAIALVDAALTLLKQPAELSQFVERCTARLDQAAKLPTAPETKLYRATLAKKAEEATVALTQPVAGRRHRR
jgi:hypothetical protein